MRHMKDQCNNELDVENNMKVIRESMIEMGIPNVPTIHELKKPLPRETLLFTVLLFHSLPYY